VWVRFTIGDPIPVQYDWDGSWFFDTGETEDYLLVIGDGGQSDAGELGDAPEDALAYPNGTMGQFPTCIAGGPIGFVYHNAPITAFFGPTGRPGGRGQPGPLQLQPVQPRRVRPGRRRRPAHAARVRPRERQPGGLRGAGRCATLPGACQTVNWGGDIDIHIDNSGGTDMLLHVLADWDRSGDWGQTVTCAGGQTGTSR
jgi:hypothetical protein